MVFYRRRYRGNGAFRRKTSSWRRKPAYRAYNRRRRKFYGRRKSPLSRRVNRLSMIAGHPEWKHSDQNGPVPYSIPPAGIGVQIGTLIDKGTSKNQRIGDKVRITSFDLRGKFSKTSNSTFTNIRWVLVRARNWQGEGAFPDPDELYNEAGTNNWWFGERNLTHIRKFQVLKSGIMTWGTEDATPVDRFWHQHFKLNTTLQYNDEIVDDATRIEHNAMWVMFYGDRLADQPTFEWTSRVRYLDQ